MRGLSEAALVVSALAGSAQAARLGAATPSALVSVGLAGPNAIQDPRHLGLRLDIHESLETCGAASISVNGQRLPNDNSQGLDIGIAPDTDDVATVIWENGCVSWDGQPREQLLRLRVSLPDGRLNYTSTADGELVIRFRQTKPATILDIEGASSVYLFDSTDVPDGSYIVDLEADGSTADDDSTVRVEEVARIDPDELRAWQQSLADLRRYEAAIRHDIHMREHFMRQRFGVSSVLSANTPFLKSLFFRISVTACDIFKGFIGEKSHVDGSWGDIHVPKWPYYQRNKTSVSPPPLPSLPPLLMHCTPLTSDDGSHNSGHTEGGEDTLAPLDGDSSGVKGDKTDGTDGITEADEDEDVAWKKFTGGGSTSNHHWSWSSHLSLLTFICFVLLCVSSCRRNRRKRGWDAEQGRIDGDDAAEASDGVNRRPSFRGRLSSRWKKISDKYHARRARREANGARRARLRAAVTSTSRFLHRILFLGTTNEEKLRGAPDRARVQRRARGHIEAVVIPSPTSPRESVEQQRSQQQTQQQQQQQRHERELQGQQRQQQEELQRQQELQEQQRLLQSQQEQAYVQQQLREQARRESARSEREHEELERQQQRQLLQRGLRQHQEQQLERQREQDARLKKQGVATPGAGAATTDLSRERAPSPTMEQEIASFRAAADVVGQIIAAEEGRIAVTRATVPRPSPAPVNQRPVPPPPPPSAAAVSETSRHAVRGSPYTYGQRDISGIDSDFDDTESVPPAYSEAGYMEAQGDTGSRDPSSAGYLPGPYSGSTSGSSYTYANLSEAEAPIVADGFQYRPHDRRY